MQKKTSTSKVVVYATIGIIALAVFAAAVIYLPGLLQTLHGTG